MRYLLGLFILMGGIQAEARTSQLILRAHVPPIYQIKITDDKTPIVYSNSNGKFVPKIKVDKTTSYHVVSIIHP
jgi:hypothetical protein